jgi:hypothetical protein
MRRNTIRKVVAVAVAVAVVAAVAGVAHLGDAKASCYILCNQYVRPYYKPSTGTWVQGYWRNSPSDWYRATPYVPRYSYVPPRYSYLPRYSYVPSIETYAQEVRAALGLAP